MGFLRNCILALILIMIAQTLKGETIFSPIHPNKVAYSKTCLIIEDYTLSNF